MKHLTLPILLLLAIHFQILAGKKTGPSAEDIYKTPQLFRPIPMPNKTWRIPNLGPIGLGIQLEKPGFTMRITRIEKGSPAETTGKLKLKQIIESINGKAPNTEIDPRILLGNIITKAESTDGIIKLKVKTVGEVVVKIPVMGSYAKTWPLNCEKSNRIVTQLAELLIKQEKLSWGNTLFLLSTGETKYLPIVKKQLDAKEKIGGIPWHYGMLGIAFCEYYLRTGDKSVLPKIDLALEGLKKMMFNGGWSGRGYGSSFTYSTGSGQLNAAGVHCVTFIMLAKMCGAKVDDEMLQRSLTNFYRNAGHGNLAYGDGWPEGGFRDNGKSSAFAIAMAAAARLTPNGETTVYAKARDNMAMKSFYATNWFHSAHTGGGIGEIWHHGAMSLMKEKRPTPYRSYMDSRTWVMDLSRRHDGSVGIAGVDDRYDQSASEHERDWGTYFALMTYTAPRKALIIFGAPKTKFCKSYPLPERPWGRPADDLFVSPDPIPGGPLSKGDLLKESVEKDSSLPVFKKMGKNLLEEYLYHPEYGLRISTISRISESSNPKKLVLKLLKEDDPRLRHLGASTISGVFKNKPLSDDQLTPEMFKLLGEMIENPEEALWVVQEAMRALSRAKIEVIAQHKKTLLGYLSHESWFLQTTAIEALSPLMAHKSYYKEVMPPVMTTFAKLRSNQAFTPVWQMQSKITSAPKEIKDFAMKEVKRAYKLIPNQLVDSYSGRLIPNGTSAIRKKISYLTDNLPENQAFKLSIPKMTAMAILSGKSEDFYHYEGFKPNPKILGTWLAPPKGNTWANDKKHALENIALIERPHRTNSQTVIRLKNWLKKADNSKAKRKRLNFKKGGNLNSNTLWTDGWLVSLASQSAQKLHSLSVNGKDYLLLQKGGFEKVLSLTDEEREAWEPKYTILRRADEVIKETKDFLKKNKLAPGRKKKK